VLEDRQGYSSLKTRLQEELELAGRTGDTIRSASTAGKLELIKTMLELPQREFEKL